MRLKKGDLVILLFLIAVGIGWFFKDTILADDIRKKAVIKIDGEVYMTLTLDSTNERKEIPLSFPNDGWMLIITEKDQIWVEESTCPEKICVLTGKISKPGQSIVDLPYKTVIYIEGSEGTDIDDISS